MRIQAKAVLFTLVCGAVAAHADTDDKVGDIKVGSVSPLTDASSAAIPEFTFIVDEARLILTTPGDRDRFDLTVESNGCLRGTVRQGGPNPAELQDDNIELREICRVPGAGDAPGTVSQWSDAESKLTFTAQLTPDGKRIIAGNGLSRGDFALDQGPAANALRNHPELLAAAFAYGYVPEAQSSSTGGMTTSEYSFVVAAE
jgi:hypothetical protein